MNEWNSLSDIAKSQIFINLIEYIKYELLYTQVEVSKKYQGMLSPALISSIKKEKRYRPDIIKRLLTLFDIKIHIEEDGVSFVGGIKNTNNYSQNRSGKKTYFETEGKIWKVISKSDEDINIRVLKINSLRDVEYVVQSNIHEDYTGTGNLINGESNLSFDLVTKETNKKHLHLRFWIGDRQAKPQLMLGVIIYSQISTNQIVAYPIIAINASADVDITPAEIPIQEFENSLIIDYFTLHSGKIHSPPGILNEKELTKYVNLRKSIA